MKSRKSLLLTAVIAARPKTPAEMTPNELLDTIDEIVTIAPDVDAQQVIEAPGADDAYDEPTQLEDGEISDELMDSFFAHIGPPVRFVQNRPLRSNLIEA